MADYDTYNNFIGSLNDVSNFKNDYRYTYVLEHVSQEQGNEYYKLLKYECNLTDNIIWEFCELNDSIGNPNKYVINGKNVSPTSLRYLYHAYTAITYFGQPNLKIVELGCGYGGLCLAINYLSSFLNVTIESYDLIDLDNAIRIQKIYLKNFQLKFTPVFHSSSTYGKDTSGNLLISSYCFSEIDKEHQVKYLEVLFPKLSKGFITWNHIPLYDIGKNVTSIVEKPLTGPGNLFVFFK